MPYLRLGFGDPVLVTSSGTYTISTGTETLTINVSADLLPSYDTTDIIGVSKTIRRGFTYLQGSTGTPSITSSVINEYGTFNNGSYSTSVTGTNNPPHRLSSFSQTIYDTAYGNVIDVVESPIIETNDVTYEDDIVIGNGNIISSSGNVLSKRGFCYTKTETDPTIDDWIVYEELTTLTTIVYTSVFSDYFNDLNNWEYENSENTLIEINPEGKLHILSTSPVQSILATNASGPVSISGSNLEIEASLLFNQLGSSNFSNDIYNSLIIVSTLYILNENGDPIDYFYLYCIYSANGLFCYDEGNIVPFQQIGTTIPSYGDGAVWQDWKWRLTNSKLEIFLKIDGEYISQGFINLIKEFTGGQLIYTMIMSLASDTNTENYFDVLKINQPSSVTVPLSTSTYSLPLTAVSTEDEFRVRSYVEYGGTRVAYGNTVIVTLTPSSNVLYWINNSGSFDSMSHWSIESGGASGSSIPDNTKDIIFDKNSFTLNNQIVTVPTTGAFNDCIITDDCKTFRMNITDYLSCNGEMIIDNSNVKIYGKVVLEENSILYGSCYIGELYCYENSTICGGNTIDTINLDVENKTPGSIFYFGTDSIQTIEHFNVLNVGEGSRAVLMPVSKPVVSFTSTPTYSLSAGSNVALNWNTLNVTDCTINDVTVATSGSMVVNPIISTTYELISKGVGGRVKNTVNISNVSETNYTDTGLSVMKPELISFTLD